MSVEDVPVIRVGPHLLVSLQGELDDTRVLRLEDQITREVVRTRARGTLIDVSGLAVVDSFMANVIGRMVNLVRLVGSEAVVVGIQPDVAIALTELGVSLRSVHTALNAGKGMELLRRLVKDEA
jgi:rsbT antagonist protein RsbS